MDGRGESASVRHAGRRYRIDRMRDVCGAGTVREFWHGHGVIGSERRWLGDRFAARSVWYAAVNPAGKPFAAKVREDGLSSRRAAVSWLLAQDTPCPAGPVRAVLLCQSCPYVWEQAETDSAEFAALVRAGCPDCGGWIWLGELLGDGPAS